MSDRGPASRARETHEVKSVAFAPGYPRFNRWNGSLEYEISDEGAIGGTSPNRSAHLPMQASHQVTMIWHRSTNL